MKIVGYIDLDNSSTIEDVYHSRSTPRSPRVFSIKKKISKEKAIELQSDLGYSPLGYGFFDFKTDLYLTTWKCSHSCD